jgi:hypothetical protein
MKVILRNANKMRNFIEENIDRKLTDLEFKDWINYLQEFSDYIDKVQNEGDAKIRIQEGASLSLELNDNEYELIVKFAREVVENELVFIADLDYTHFEEI